MLSSFGVSKSLREAKIDKVDVGRLLMAYQEVVRLDVSVKVIATLDMFDSL